MVRRRAVSILLIVAIAGCMETTSSGGGPGTTSVTIRDNGFAPVSRTVTAGTIVKWTNAGTLTHTTTSSSGAWNSGNLSPPTGGTYGGGSAGATFSFTFTVPGTYAYGCQIHPAIQGTVTVTP